MAKTSRKSSKNSKVKLKDTKLDENKNTKKELKDKKTVNKAKLFDKTKIRSKNDEKETQNNDKLEDKSLENSTNEQDYEENTKSNKKFKILDILFNNNSSNTFLDSKHVDNLKINEHNSTTNIAKTNNNVPVVKDTTVKLVENKELNEILNRFLKNLCQITEKILSNNLNYNEGFAILLKDVNLIKSTINPKLVSKSNLYGNRNGVDKSNKNNKLANEVINILYEKLLLIVIYTCKYFVSGKSGNNTLIENMTNLLYKLITHIFDEFILDNSEDDNEYNQNKLLLVIVNNSCLDEIIINSKLYRKHIFNILSLIVNANKPNAKEGKDRDIDLVLYKLLQSFQVKDVLNMLLANLNNDTSSDVKTLIINIINITDNNVLNNIVSRLNDNDPRVKAEVYKKFHQLFNDLNTEYVVHIFHNFLSDNRTVPNSSRFNNKVGDGDSSESNGINEIHLDEEFYNMLTNWITNLKDNNYDSNYQNNNNSRDNTINVNTDSSNTSRTDKDHNKNNTNKLVEFINYLLKKTLQLTPVLDTLVKYFQYLNNKYNKNNLNEDELVIFNEFTNSIYTNNVLFYIYNTLQVDSESKLEVDTEKLVNELKTLVNCEELKKGGKNTYLVVNNINIVLVLLHNHLTTSTIYINTVYNNQCSQDSNEDTSNNNENMVNNVSNNSNKNGVLFDLEVSLVKLIKSAPLKYIVIKLISEYIELTNLNFNHSLNNGYLLTNNLIYYVLQVLFSLNSSNNQMDNYKNGLKLESILNDIFDPHNISTIKKIRIDFNNVKLIRSIKEISKFDFSNYSIDQLIQFTNQINSKLTLYSNNNNILKNILKNNRDNNNLVNKELNENLLLINKYKSLLDKINTELNGRYTSILLLVYVYFNLPNTGGDLSSIGVMDNSANMYNISGTSNIGSLELVNRVYSKYILNVLRMYTGNNLDNNTIRTDKDNNSNKIGGLEYYNNVLLLKILCVYNFVLFNSNYSDISTVTSNIRNELNVYHVLFTNIIESIGSTKSTKTNKASSDFGSKGPIPGGANGLASPPQSSPFNQSLYTPSQSPTNSPKINNSISGSSKLVENILKGILQIFDGGTIVNNYIYSILIKLLPKILYVIINSGNSKLLFDYSTVIIELLIFYSPNSSSNNNSIDITNNYGNSNSNNSATDRLYINNYDLGILQSTPSYLYNNYVDIGNTLNRIIITTFHYYFNNLIGVSYVLSNVKYFLINLINLSTNSNNNYNLNFSTSNGNTDNNVVSNNNQDKKSVVNIIVHILSILLKSNKYTNINELLLVINFIITKKFILFHKNNMNNNSNNKDNNGDNVNDNNNVNKSNSNTNTNTDDSNNLNNVYILLKYYYVKHNKHYRNNKLLLFILNQLNPNSDTKLTQNEQSLLSTILSNKNKTRDKNEVVTKKPYCKYLLVSNSKNTNKLKRRRVVDLETTSSSGGRSYNYYEEDDDEDSFVTDSEYYTDTTY